MPYVSRYLLHGSSCSPPWWAHASVKTSWLKGKGELSADALFTCLSVAFLSGPIPYHDVGPYGSYVPSAEICWHVFYTKSTHPLQRIIRVMWLNGLALKEWRHYWIGTDEPFEICCEYTDIFPFSSLIIYSLNYFPDIFTIYLFKPYYLEVTDIFLHFSH